MTIDDARHKIVSLLTPEVSVTILSHRNPDSDSLGSSLGLAHHLTRYTRRVAVVTPNPAPRFLNFFPGAETVINAESDYERALWNVENAQLLFCLDFGTLDRIEPLDAAVRRAAGTLIHIDHHLDFEPFASLVYRNPNACSTSELVYTLIKDDGISPDSATCLYSGILTDTVSFKVRITPEVHRVVAELISAGADINKVHEGINGSYTENRLRMTGFALLNRLCVLPEYKTAYIMLTAQDTERFNLEDGDTEGLVNFTLYLEGVNFGVLMTERKDMVKMSFRSRGSFSARDFAAHFDGGGHYNAAGGRSRLSPAETETKFLALLRQVRDQLLY
jgi:phosphoesterase RecJ-like protein